MPGLHVNPRRVPWHLVLVLALALATVAGVPVRALGATETGDDAATTGIERLEQLKRSLSRHPVWQATYRQEYTGAGMTIAETITGTVWVALPDQAFFQAVDPPVNVMGMAGRTVRLLDLEGGSCEEYTLNDQEWARVPLAALLEPADALAQFMVLGRGEGGLVLIPHDQGGIKRVEVELDEQSMPKVVVVVDPQGTTNRLSFSGWAAAAAPPAGQWLPVVPAGVECVVAE